MADNILHVRMVFERSVISEFGPEALAEYLGAQLEAEVGKAVGERYKLAPSEVLRQALAQDGDRVTVEVHLAIMTAAEWTEALAAATQDAEQRGFAAGILANQRLQPISGVYAGGGE